MAPKRSGMALLFHPKKKTTQAPRRQKEATPQKESSPQKESTPQKEGTPSGSPSPSKPTVALAVRPRPPPRPQDNDDDLRPPPPEGPFQEFKLVSSQLNGWKYDVMKFDSRKAVDISTWRGPVKLNRKEPRREADDGVIDEGPRPVGPMLGPDGKPVVGPDGRIVMVDAEGRPIRPGEGGNASGDKGKEKAGQKKRFQKKTRQVFLVPEDVRKLRKEERYPWMMEDSTGEEIWVGKMEEVSKSETHCMFMPADNFTFKLVPAHRWYKFQKKPKYHVPTLEEAEKMMSNIKKNQDPERWLLRKRNGQGPSAETAALFKAERDGSTGPIPSSSLGPGGRRLRTVDDGMSGLFGDDDEEEGEGRRRRMKRELGAEGDVDEMDFEETFEDDDQQMEPDDREDEEAKELEERLKREYKNANKTREGYVDESEDEDEPTLTRAGKGLRKTLQKLEKDGGYDESDEDENPYASEVEEEEEEPIPVYTGPAIIAPEPKPGRQPSQSNGTKTPTSSQPSSQVKPDPQSDSRPTSPVIPSHGGHSALAKRAMSPKMPKLDSNGMSRVTSPNGSRAVSPAVSRAGSPTFPTSSVGSAAANGVNGAAKSNDKKRKATDDPNAKPKKRKAFPPLPDGATLDDRTVIEWLMQTPNATTRDCIHHFQPYLTDDEKKHRFTTLVKEVAQLKDGVLVLRPAYQSIGAPSPPQVAASAA